MTAQTNQFTITASANGVYGPDSRFIDTRGYTFCTIFVTTLGGTSVAVRPVGSAHPSSATASPLGSAPGTEALSYRTSGNAAYQSTTTTINAGAFDTFHLDPADFMPFIGLELSGMVGTVNVTATVYLS